MPPTRTPRIRLRSHLLANNPAATPEATVAHFGAMQAQDYRGALWAVGVRTRAVDEREVEAAIEARRIVRCWPMRGTLHFVAAPDVRWMLELLAPRVLERNRPRLEREFDLDRATLRRARRIIERTLKREAAATRPELYAALDAGGVATARGRGLHVLFALAHDLAICFGARRGKQPTFVLLDAWVPPSAPKTK
ncbi:MAG TPA: crosslink repair DNA glycosylase YcaQ family protein, partial [Thermoanaerobaculia bacterium]